MITASVDSLSFLRGAYVKDTVVIIGKVTYVGNTSMEVKVDTYVEALSGGTYANQSCVFYNGGTGQE